MKHLSLSCAIDWNSMKAQLKNHRVMQMMMESFRNNTNSTWLCNWTRVLPAFNAISGYCAQEKAEVGAHIILYISDET